METKRHPFNEMVNGYLSAILFAELDSEEQPLDNNYSKSDFSAKSVLEIRKMMRKYVAENKVAIEKSGLASDIIGMDIWDTQAGHGAGFFDHNLDKEVEKQLTKSAEELGEYLYVEVSDNGKIEVRGLKTFAKGGEIESYRYLNIKHVNNGIELSLNESGKQEVAELRESHPDWYGEMILMELFEDIQGNSEYIFHLDGGESGFGLTNAPMITDGYYPSETGRGYDTDYPDSAKVYYFGDYMVVSPLDVLLKDGKVVFTEAKEHGGIMAEGGDVEEEYDPKKDLFVHYEKQPAELKAVLKEYEDEYLSDGATYELNERVLKAIKPLGYIFDYDLDAEPYNLRKMKVGEKFRAGDFVFANIFKNESKKVPFIVSHWSNDRYYIFGDGSHYVAEDKLAEATEKDFDDYYGKDVAESFKIEFRNDKMAKGGIIESIGLFLNKKVSINDLFNF